MRDCGFTTPHEGGDKKGLSIKYASTNRLTHKGGDKKRILIKSARASC
ncbi:MAG TPA: hypothetical protein PKX91_05380 [Clostridia bacterium]|nr:hypothetical protein [Clostridia bacterium]